MDTTRIVRFEDECVLIPEYDRSTSENGGGGGAFGFKKLMIPLFKRSDDSFIHKARSPTSPSLASPLPSCLVHRDISTPTGRKVQRRPSLPLPVKVISSSTSPNLPSLSPSLSKSPSTYPNPNPFTLPTTIPSAPAVPIVSPQPKKPNRPSSISSKGVNLGIPTKANGKKGGVGSEETEGDDEEGEVGLDVDVGGGYGYQARGGGDADAAQTKEDTAVNLQAVDTLLNIPTFMENDD
ncbi:hypothetical protein D9758_017745, partial [Tetrapyrgos nigripes]